MVYNGHKPVHAIKFQAVVIPSGLVANLYGPIEGRRYDAGMLKESGLFNMLQIREVTPTGDIPILSDHISCIPAMTTH